jgi:hypothetical protein
MDEPRGRSGALSFWQGLYAEFSRYQDAVRDMPIEQLKLQDDLRRYLCLRCAGFLEQVTYTILTEFLEQKSSSPVLEFAKSYFNRAPNLKAKTFVELLAKLGSDYSSAFEIFLEAGGRRDTLNDLLDVRNDVAHGKYHGGRKLQPDRYVSLCEDIYDWLVETFLQDSVEIIDQDGRTRLGTTSATV